MHRMSASIPPSLGKPVTTRQLTWLQLAMQAWGSEFNAPDHGIYEFSNGRKWDSTDKNTTGIYNDFYYLDLMIDNAQYPDMPGYLLTEQPAFLSNDYDIYAHPQLDQN